MEGGNRGGQGARERGKRQTENRVQDLRGSVLRRRQTGLCGEVVSSVDRLRRGWTYANPNSHTRIVSE